MAEKRKMAKSECSGARDSSEASGKHRRCHELGAYSYLKHKHKCMSLPISIETLSLRHAEYELCV